MSAAPPEPSATTAEPDAPPPSPDDGAASRALDLAWAGRVVFPRSPDELRSTATCPACHSPLREARCPRCALDLTHPSAIELADVSRRAADLLDARVALIGRIRRERAAAVAAQVATAPAPAATHPAAGPPSSTAPLLPPSGAAEPRSGRSSVQVALTIVGISLLAVFAVFGVVYAFVTFGEGVRFTIIAAGTAATLAAAGLLARRGLAATAEGVALLGTLVLLLDAWALRASDAVGLAGIDERAYWGAALALVGAICAAWSRWGRLGGPALAAVVLAPLGAALLVSHAATPLDGVAGVGAPAASTALGAVASLVVAAGHPLLRRAERPVLAIAAACAALAVAIVSALLALGTLTADLALAALPTQLLVSSIAGGLALHAVVLARTSPPSIEPPARAVPNASAAAWDAEGAAVAELALETRAHRALATLAAGLAVLTLIVGSAIAAVRLDEPALALALPLLLAAVLVIALERRQSTAAETLAHTSVVGAAALRAALLAAAALGAVAAGVAGVVALGAPLEAVLASTSPFELRPDSPIARPEPPVVIAIAGLALAAGLLAAGWAARGLLRSRARGITPVVGALAIVAVPMLASWWAVVATSSALALLAAIALHRVVHIADRGDRRALVVGLSPMAVGGSLLALLAAPAVDGAWIIGVTVALVVIAVCRALPSRRQARALAVALGAGIVIASAWPLRDDLAEAGLVVTDAVVVLSLASIIVMLSTLGRLAGLERRAAAAVVLVPGAVSAAALGRPAEAATGASALAVAALVVVIARGLREREARDRGPELRLAGLLLAPTVVLLALSALSGVQQLPPGSGELVATLTLLVLVAVALAADLRSERVSAHRLRASVDAGAAAMIALVLGAALAIGGPLPLGAIAPLGWLGSPAAGGGHALLSVVLLGTALVVLLIAVSRDGLVGSHSPRRHLGWLALALAVAALWVQLGGDGVREPEPFVLPVAGALLLLAAWVARVVAGGRGAAALVGSALALAGVPTALASGDEPNLRGAGVAVAAAALALLAAHRRSQLDGHARGSSRAVAVASLAALTALALTQVAHLVSAPAGTDEQVRAVLLVVVLAGIGLGAWFAEGSTERTLISAGGLGLAALVAAALGIAAIVDPVELLSLPVALALLAVGTLALERDERARSGRWLTPGLVILLLPSLIAVESSPDLWRVVGLGVVATAVFVGGVVRRLRAPVLVGGIVLLVHLLVQSWPLLRTIGESVEWWLWLGLAGIAVVAIAARYERRLQDARALVRRIRDLR